APGSHCRSAVLRAPQRHAAGRSPKGAGGGWAPARDDHPPRCAGTARSDRARRGGWRVRRLCRARRGDPRRNLPFRDRRRRECPRDHGADHGRAGGRQRRPDDGERSAGDRPRRPRAGGQGRRCGPGGAGAARAARALRQL
ncbi:MAG: 6,7-dimethyl-8-ribityllumazine synthase, partial [uncultured Sphingomonas sp.]